MNSVERNVDVILKRFEGSWVVGDKQDVSLHVLGADHYAR